MDPLLQPAVDAARAGDFALCASICADVIEVRSDHEDAWQILRELVEFELEGEACLEVARALEAAGMPQESLGWWRRGLVGAPQASEGWRRLGLALLREDAYREASEAFACAGALLPDDAQVKLYEGLSLEADGQFSAARVAYLSAEHLDPLDLDVVLRLSGVCQRLRRYPESIAALQHAVALRPGDAKLSVRLSAMSERYPQLMASATALSRRRDADAGRWCNGALLAERRGDRAAAVAALEQALSADPEHATARHLHAAYTGATVTSPPPGYVKELFDGYASHFEAHLVDELGYRLPEALGALARRALLPLERVLDLGCGTGLLGPHVRPPAQRLVGVDLSGLMLNRARQVGLYDELIQLDAVDYLGLEGGESFDAIFAAEVLLYVGAVDALFAAAAGRLSPGGGLLLSVEQIAGTGFVLRPSGRFAHSSAYIHAQAEAAGLVVSRREEVPMRRSGDGWETGEVFLLQRRRQ